MSLRLDARKSERVTSLLEHPDLIAQLLDGFGSPLNLLLPQQIVDNTNLFQGVLRSNHVAGRTLFAHKTNRSSALVRQLVASGTGIDVASLGELQHALSCGFGPGQIVVGGPKNPELLALAAQVGAVVVADSVGELRRLAELVDQPLPVMVRVSGFESEGTTILSRPSRFGVDVDHLDDALEVIEVCKHLSLRGLAFHLDTVALAEKATALQWCIEAMDRCQQLGHDPRVIDIGGGYKVSYLEDRNQWDTYITALRQAASGERESITWNQQNFGLRNDNGTLRGQLGVYDYFDDLTSSSLLQALLAYEGKGGRTLGARLLDSLYTLEIEPGRALADQCGLTVARVLDVRTTPDGHHLVNLDMNRRDCTIEDNEVFVDPVVLARSQSTEESDEVAVFFTGNLCLESDFITRRLVYLDRLPVVGDAVVFFNTAGYLMDFNADSALQQRTATKIALHQSVDETWSWCVDDLYWPHTFDEAAR